MEITGLHPAYMHVIGLVAANSHELTTHILKVPYM